MSLDRAELIRIAKSYVPREHEDALIKDGKANTKLLIHVPAATARKLLAALDQPCPEGWHDRHAWPDGEGECLHGCGVRRARRGRASWGFWLGDRPVTQGSACIANGGAS